MAAHQASVVRSLARPFTFVLKEGSQERNVGMMSEILSEVLDRFEEVYLFTNERSTSKDIISRIVADHKCKFYVLPDELAATFTCGLTDNTSHDRLILFDSIDSHNGYWAAMCSIKKDMSAIISATVSSEEDVPID